MNQYLKNAYVSLAVNIGIVRKEKPPRRKNHHCPLQIPRSGGAESPSWNGAVLAVRGAASRPWRASASPSSRLAVSSRLASPSPLSRLRLRLRLAFVSWIQHSTWRTANATFAFWNILRFCGGWGGYFLTAVGSIYSCKTCGCGGATVVANAYKRYLLKNELFSNNGFYIY